MIILYATGGGEFMAQIGDGQVIGDAPTATRNAVAAQVGGIPADVCTQARHRD